MEVNECLLIWLFVMEICKVSLLDVDGDGDMDVYFFNVGWFFLVVGIDWLLLNDGNGFFMDVIISNFFGSIINEIMLEVLLFDFDQDGDMDFIFMQWLVLGL